MSAFLYLEGWGKLINGRTSRGLPMREVKSISLRADMLMTPAILRLVRHRSTRAYLGKDGLWTDNPALAQQFEDVRAILKLQREQNLAEIEIVLQMGSEPSAEYDIALPLGNTLR